MAEVVAEVVASLAAASASLAAIQAAATRGNVHPLDSTEMRQHLGANGMKFLTQPKFAMTTARIVGAMASIGGKVRLTAKNRFELIAWRADASSGDIVTWVRPLGIPVQSDDLEAWIGKLLEGTLAPPPAPAP